MFVLRTCIQWKALPKSYGASSSVHKYFQEWREAGFFTALWERGVALYDEQKGIGWRWQAIDGANRHDVSQLGAVLDSKITHQSDTAKAAPLDCRSVTQLVQQVPQAQGSL